MVNVEYAVGLVRCLPRREVTGNERSAYCICQILALCAFVLEGWFWSTGVWKVSNLVSGVQAIE
jgi:hypothetical protein